MERWELVDRQCLIVCVDVEWWKTCSKSERSLSIGPVDILKCSVHCLS